MKKLRAGRTLHPLRGCMAAVSVLALCAANPAAAQDEAAAAPAGDPKFRFDVMEYVVRGNSVLTAADIQTVLMPHAGYGKSVPDVEVARSELEKAYRDRGYATVVVEIPQQDVSSGILELVVTEGKVGRVRVTGADFVLPSEVRGALPSLKPGTVPNVPTLQQELSSANARTTRTITPEFKAGAAPGTVDIELAVEDKKPWGASIEVSDQYNRSTERFRLNVSANYDNLWQAGHSANIFFQTAPEDFDQVQVVSGSYYAPLGYGRSSLLGYIVNSNTDVATVGGLTVLGNGLTVGGRFMRTLGNSPQGTVQSLLFGVDYKDYLDQIGLVDPETGETLTFDTPVTYLPFTAQYRWLGGNTQSNGEFSIGTTFAFDGLVGRQREFGYIPDNPLTPNVNEESVGKRAGAEASFIYFYGSGVYNRQLKNDFDLRAALDWQLAPAPLISNEQFVLGGVGSIRGYREAEVLGDSGARLSLELGYKLPTGAEKIDWRVAAFLEGGYAWIESPLPEEKSSFWLGSAGLTTRFDLYKIFYGQLDLAYQFRSDPTKSGQPVQDDLGGLRAHFKVGLKY
ncbi:MAG: ShlB/FhaC/HecB family hemolysin secretion/activation protein [Sphingopyxis sp.]|uniref:ShlB/FhaC/HecB family hemolysin secretion/activation protein n=1 Tax=Sphingopyxis sp. TaxID=1908224 RepID=UPI001A2E5F0F|nr:ShlB/FhaC/HecB family hemolysin secretion/activation protein [Sphingopyxis sp.]MBJ7498648.1 ShlB/FhaC/HecB family hemolysin secretion/activation protein [Sphingopyxis sp.]